MWGCTCSGARQKGCSWLRSKTGVELLHTVLLLKYFISAVLQFLAATARSFYAPIHPRSSFPAPRLSSATGLAISSFSLRSSSCPASALWRSFPSIALLHRSPALPTTQPLAMCDVGVVRKARLEDAATIARFNACMAKVRPTQLAHRAPLLGRPPALCSVLRPARPSRRPTQPSPSRHTHHAPVAAFSLHRRRRTSNCPATCCGGASRPCWRGGRQVRSPSRRPCHLQLPAPPPPWQRRLARLPSLQARTTCWRRAGSS